MNDRPKLVFYPSRLLAVFPIVFLAQGFETDVLRYIFIVTLALITSRLFPVIVALPPEKDIE